MEHPQIIDGEAIEFEFLCPTLEAAVEVVALGLEAGCKASTIHAVHQTGDIVYWLKLILKDAISYGSPERTTARMQSIAEETRTSYKGWEPVEALAI